MSSIDAYGLDGSHHQTLTDPQAVFDNGIRFAWWKATEGTTYVDRSFADCTRRLQDTGIATGAYHFAYGTDAVEQAEFFQQVAAPLLTDGCLRPMLDMESSTVGLAPAANAFVRQFYDALDMPLVVYGNLSWWTTVLDPASWRDRDIVGMIARYNGDPGNPGWTYPGMAVHQHSNAGVVPGISTVDRDAIFNGHSLAELIIASRADDAAIRRGRHRTGSAARTGDR